MLIGGGVGGCGDVCCSGGISELLLQAVDVDGVEVCQRVLQCVEVYWSVLECVVVCFSVLRCAAAEISELKLRTVDIDRVEV